MVEPGEFESRVEPGEFESRVEPGEYEGSGAGRVRGQRNRASTCAAEPGVFKWKV